MLYDKDEDGSITMAELGVVMRSLGQRPSGEIMKMLSQNLTNFVNKFVDLSFFLSSHFRVRFDGNTQKLSSARWSSSLIRMTMA